MPNKALDTAFRKGREAAARGEGRESCPYIDKRTDYHRGVTFSRAFQNWWYEGYDSYQKEKESEPK